MTESNELRCVIAAGGTAGHVLPALAVAEALRDRGVTVTFAGSPDRVEARLAPEAGFEFDAFRITGIPRRPSIATLRALLLAGRAPVACRRILARRRPHVVLGGGGFVAGPMVLAARTRRIPAALTEADAHLGLANRLAAPYATRVFLAYPVAGLREPKYRVVGRPIPARSRPVDQADARREFGLPAEGRALGVFGALAGARSLNELAVEALGDVGPPVLHVSGERDHRWVRSRVRREDYVLLPSTDRIGAAYSAVDLVLARAGGSVWEVAAAGKPAVLVPYPYATGDHQTKNAQYFQRAGGAVVVQESELGTVPSLVRSLLDDPARLAAMGEAMRTVARPDAADEIAEALLELVRR
jgi:UDP-N-acetylglucosamine--N-acetylmuramyl-(pentapeptide) pyrophosphoryl-undecaprenol N-acetylglucosamine transferase